MHNRVRLPMQVGTSSLWSVARSAATLVPAVVLLIGAALALMEETGGAALLGGVIGVYFLLYGTAHIFRAWRTRASDAVLDAQGISFEGGAQHGLAVGWDQIDAGGTKAETNKEARLTIQKMVGDVVFLVMSSVLSDKLELAPPDKVPIRRLHLKTRDGREVQLAEAEHPAEQRSLDALLETIKGKLGVAEPPAPSADHKVLSCNHCGAALVPTDADAATCGYCGTANPMPQEVRERIRAHHATSQSQQHMARHVESLLRQPGARRTNVVLLLAAVISSLVWVPVVAGLLIAGLRTVGGFEVGWALVSGAIAVVAVFVLARARLASRRALRLLTSGFGARAPKDARGGYSCRRCGGALPPTQQIVVRCAYCDADNLLGIDMRSQAKPTKEHELSLADALRAQKADRSKWLVISLTALLLAPISGAMAYGSYEMAAEHAEQRTRCKKKKKAKACLEVARDFSLGMGVGEDEDKAYEYEKLACEYGSGEACLDLSERFRWGWAVAESPELASEYRQRSCELGHKEACKPPD